MGRINRLIKTKMKNCAHLKEVKHQFNHSSSIPLSRLKVLAECVTCKLPKPHLWFCIGCWHKNDAFYCLDHLSSHASMHHRVFYSFRWCLLHCTECSSYISVPEIRSKKIRKILSRLEKVETLIAGQTGLVNLGNTCYMNVAIQCLNSLPSISKFFLELSPYYTLDEHSEDTVILRSFQHLLSTMWEDSPTITPSNFANNFSQVFSHFEPKTQQDAQEFIRQLLESLNTSLLKAGFATTVIDRTFGGVLEKEVTCKHCGFQAQIDEQIYELSLPLPEGDSVEESSEFSFGMMEIPDKKLYKKRSETLFKRIKTALKLHSHPHSSLYDCLISFFKPEEINDNTVYCEHCDEYSHRSINYSIKEFPNVFIVVLKRFKYARKCEKVSSHVQMPLNLRLSEFATDKKALCDYELSAIIEHLGTFNRGHYRAFIKHCGLQSWFKFNDSNVVPVSQDKILNAHTYIAFYKKVNLEKISDVPKVKEVYIPKEWMLNYHLLQNPGVIEIKKFVCPHGKLTPKVTSEVLLGISYEEFNRMKDIYGSDHECLASNKICGKCVQYIRALPHGIDLENKIISKMPEEHGEFFVLSSKWVEIWRKFFNLDMYSPGLPEKPSTIRNACLMENGCFNSRLEIGIDYFMVESDTWYRLKHFYGVDFEIKMETGQFFENSVGVREENLLAQVPSFPQIS